jgi:hypothetical protein
MPLASPHRVSNFEKCCFACSAAYLQIINIIDFFAGLFFIVFTIYLFDKLGEHSDDFVVSWLGWSSLFLGVLLLLLSCLTCCAITSEDCRCMISPTDFLIVIIVLFCLVMGVLSVELHSLFTKYVNDHGGSWGLSRNDIDDIENWYWFIAFGFFVVMGMEVTRFVFNRYFKGSARRIDREYDSLLNEDNLQWDEQFAENKVKTEKKYKDLRAYYKQKYGEPASGNEMI